MAKDLNSIDNHTLKMYNYYSVIYVGGLCPLRFTSHSVRKNNERLLGIKMKKFVILLLVFSILSFTGCDLVGQIGGDTTELVAAPICEIANRSKPTKITTDVNYVTKTGDVLAGHYVLTTDGTDAIFEYYYQRLATPAESLEMSNYDRIITSEGVINYKDGSYYSGDGEPWKPGTGTAFELKFNVAAELLKDVVLSEDLSSLDAKVSAEDLKSFIGTDLNAVGDAAVSITTNGVNLTGIVISCSTENGDMVIRNSYTYNPQDLFPAVDENA